MVLINRSFHRFSSLSARAESVYKARQCPTYVSNIFLQSCKLIPFLQTDTVLVIQRPTLQ